MKILLIEPLVPSNKVWGSFSTEGGYIPSIGLLSIYTYLKEKGYDISFVDTQFEENNDYGVIRRILKEGQFDIIGIPVLTSTASYSFSTAKICKDILPGSKVVFGNVHASALPARTLQECREADFIIMGEGEYSLARLVEYIDKGEDAKIDKMPGLAFRKNSGDIKINSPAPLINDLSSLPSNIYKDIDVKKYIPHPGKYLRLPSAAMLTQRGCPFKCNFCDAHLIHGRHSRLIPIDNVIEQISYLVEKHGVKDIQFQDSTFTLKKNYVVELLNRFKKQELDITWSCITRVDCIDEELIRLMKETGCWQIAFGIESGNQETLDFMEKGKKVTIELIRKQIAMVKLNNIFVENSFILGMPNEDENMVKKTITFAKQLRPHKALFYLPVPYPGTKLYEQCKMTGGIRKDIEWDDFLAVDFQNPVYVNPRLGKDKMQYYYRKAWRSFYSSPLVWLDNMRMIKSLHDLKRYYRGARALFSFFS